MVAVYCQILLVIFIFLSPLCQAESGNPDSTETIKIGAIFAKTGAAASANLHHFQAARFAVDEINARGGLLGRTVELLEFDNASTPIQSKLAAKKAVDSGVIAVIGASWSSHSLAIAPVLQTAGIPMISPDSTNPEVTRKGDYIFRACFIDSFQGEALAKFVRDSFQTQTAVIITKITSAYSLGLAEAFRDAYSGLGGRVLREFEYKQDDTDFRDMLEKTAQLKPDVLFVPGHDESGLIVKQAQEMGIHAIFLGGDGWAYQRFFSNGGRDLKSGYFTSHWTKDLDTPKSRDFVHRYRQRYDLNEFAAVVYDAAMILAEAISRAGSLDRRKIRDELAKTKSFEGVTGAISFNRFGDSIKQAAVMKIVDGTVQFHDMVQP
ncbi:MAG: ABC transporter substrate-binding protein [Pseudomonadales bacterium]|nr:ABC transporter substrate-binding protein [Pseudomonadales bacterium]